MLLRKAPSFRIFIRSEKEKPTDRLCFVRRVRRRFPRFRPNARRAPKVASGGLPPRGCRRPRPPRARSPIEVWGGRRTPKLARGPRPRRTVGGGRQSGEARAERARRGVREATPGKDGPPFVQGPGPAENFVARSHAPPFHFGLWTVPRSILHSCRCNVAAKLVLRGESRGTARADR